MRIQENMIDNKNVIQIYISKQEEENLEIKNRIQEIKSKNNVVLFISGNTETNIVLKEMVLR